MQQYLLWAVLAMAAYALVPVLSKIAEAELPMLIVALIANVIVVVINVAVVVYLGDLGRVSMSPASIGVAVIAGILLGVAVVSYFHALSIGPVSVVVPIFGLFLVFSAVAGFLILDESLTARNVIGLALAMAAIYLTAV